MAWNLTEESTDKNTGARAETWESDAEGFPYYVQTYEAGFTVMYVEDGYPAGGTSDYQVFDDADDAIAAAERWAEDDA